MVLSGPLAKLVSSSRNWIRDGWNALHAVPGGRVLFSRAIGRMAPYTSTIGAVVQRLEPGQAEISMTDRRNLRNHLGSIHAVALANLAELTGSMVLAYTIRDDQRFIPTGLTIDYVKKARGTVTATAACEVPSTEARTELSVPVVLRNAEREEVARATLRAMIGPKVQSKPATAGDRTNLN